MAAAWTALAHAREALGQEAAAICAFLKAAALDTDDEAGASRRLARLGAAPAPKIAPQPYVKSLFGQYAPRFDDHLVNQLSHRAPGQLLEAIDRLREGRMEHVVDLDCGTGLRGVAFRAKAVVMTGVDLSPEMIAKARVQELYDFLHVQDLGAYLDSAQTASIDLLLAADVLTYVGDLDPLLHGAQRVLRRNGLFAFTLQRDIETATAAYWVFGSAVICVTPTKPTSARTRGKARFGDRHHGRGIKSTRGRPRHARSPRRARSPLITRRINSFWKNESEQVSLGQSSSEDSRRVPRGLRAATAA